MRMRWTPSTPVVRRFDHDISKAPQQYRRRHLDRANQRCV
jgi:hypothetical protein